MSRVYAAGFTAVMNEAVGFNEHNDCSVKAIAITTGCGYPAAHAAMKTQGRRNRCGGALLKMERACKALGYTMAIMPRASISAKTTRTIPSDPALKAGDFILYTRGHVAAIKDGEVIDHSEGRLRRVKSVYTITPIADADRAPTNHKMPAGSAKWQSFSKYTKHDQITLI